MIDVSMQGAKLTLNVSALASGNIVLEFTDEGTPIDFPDLETCGYDMSMNGELVTWTKPTPIVWNITLIPGSRSDRALRNLLYAGHVGGRGGKAIQVGTVFISTAALQVPSIFVNGVAESAGSQTFTFSNGRLTGGRAAIGANREGKMSPSTYRFVFESVKLQ